MTKPTTLDELSDQDVARLLEEVDRFFDNKCDDDYLPRCPAMEKLWNAVKDDEDDLAEWAEILRHGLHRKAAKYMMRVVYVPFFTVEKKDSDDLSSPRLIISRRGRSISVNPEAFFDLGAEFPEYSSEKVSLLADTMRKGGLFDMSDWCGDCCREILNIVREHLTSPREEVV